MGAGRAPDAFDGGKEQTTLLLLPLTLLGRPLLFPGPLPPCVVWAEVTQQHYDKVTLQFVTQPHETDQSFQRIGKALQAAKATRGLA